MNVVFDVLDDDAIENVITCLNFQIDKVVFFGDKETVKRNKKRTKNFLLNDCFVTQVEFYCVDSENLDMIMSCIEQAIDTECYENDRLFFDLTGGEGLLYISFGILASKRNLPMHHYDVFSNSLIELNDVGYSISTIVPVQRIILDVEKYIKMQGGIIKLCAHKQTKDPYNPELMPYIHSLWNVAKKYSDIWNSFSTFLRNELNNDDGLTVYANASRIISAVSNNKAINKPKILFDILDDLQNVGALENVIHKNAKVSFKYKNQDIKECLFDGGCILELHTFVYENRVSDYCQVGVHLDWDGVLHTPESSVKDVVNEIDVLSMTNNIPHFISCKSGNLTSGQAMDAMYELSSVARRFGGKYVKMSLAVSKSLRDVDIERANEMGISIYYY